MADKFNNRYRISSARLQSWDYGSSGLYFITICTKNRERYFGEISNGEMHLSEIGEIVKTEWIKTFAMRPDMNLEMDEYVVMPNHFHGIIMIGENRYNAGTDGMGRPVGRDAMHCVSTPSPSPSTPPQPTDEKSDDETKSNTHSKNKFGPQSKNLASIIRGFKIGVTTNVRKINSDFAWQPRYHDHIIRNHTALQNIRNYIIHNPQQWKTDEFHN